MAKGIFWLASYPKSGNTWFRVFLANLLKSGEPVDLNQMMNTIASARTWMDDALGFKSAYLSHDELDKLRPQIYQWHGLCMEEVGYHKIHDAYTYLDNQTPLIPTSGCLGALYFIRNPLDVVVSFSHHMSCTIDEAIDIMGNGQYALCKGTHLQLHQLRQWLLTWSMHVNSWINAKHIPVLVLRYEDMKLRPNETFTKAAHFLQLNANSTDIDCAIHNATIDKLQQWETQFGFNEKPPRVERFFRKGQVGDWQTTLTDAQIQRIIHDHGETMNAFSYLDTQGNPILEKSS